MNLSETAFVSHGWTKGNKLTTAPDSDLLRRTLRWFTPTIEVVLCGHATIASTRAICDSLGGNKAISFESKYSGKLGAVVESDEAITLNFPSNPTHALNQDPKENPWLADIMKHLIGSRDIVQDIQYSPGTKTLFIRLKDAQGPDGLRNNVKPNYQALTEIDTNNFVSYFIVTVKGAGGSGPNFYSRFFAPSGGINEDPVTGMAHTALTPYWAKEFGTDGPFKARQHSMRGGDLVCTLVGDRVKISGQARIGLKGELFV